MAFHKRKIALSLSKPAIRKKIIDCLFDSAYDVTEYDKDESSQPDLFILDASSAGRVSRQVLALKKASGVFLPVIVALDADEPIDPWLADGFDDCLQEPFSKAQLEVRASVLLRLRAWSEKLIRRNETKYEAIFEATGAATLLVDEDCTIVMANRTCLPVTGYHPEELIGTKWINYVAPESLDDMMKHHRARRGVEAIAPDRYEAKLVNKSGEARDTILEVRMVSGTAQSVVSLLDVTERRRAEAVVLKAEQRYRVLFERAPVMAVITRNEGGVPLITECNEMFLDTLGYMRSEVVGRHLADLYTHESRRALLSGGYHRAMDGSFVAEERQLVARDGRVVDALVRAVPETDYQGRISGTLAMFVDLTDLRASEARYKALFDNEHTVMLVIDPESAAIVDANQAATLFYGWSHEELMRKMLFDINTLPPPKVFDRLEQACSMKRHEFEFQHRLADGSVRDVNVFNGPIWIGSKKFVLSVIHDISWRKHAEAQNRLLLQAIAQAGEAVMVADRDGIILYVNPAFEKVTGYANNEAVGQNPRFLKSGNRDDAFYREMWATISSGKTWRGRFENKRKNGVLYTEDATISPICDDRGDVVSYVAVKRDITDMLSLQNEKDRLEGQLRHAQKMEAVGRLAGGIAHDFNNMLHVILGYGEIILQKLHQEDPLREDIEEIVKAGQRSAALTRQLLAFSRKQPLQPEVLDANVLLRNLEMMLRRLIGEDIDLQLVSSAEPAYINADPRQIEQVILDLAVNSRDAMPHGGTLTIETALVELDDQYAQANVEFVPDWYVIISVTDTGCGMDKETIAKIFEPFFTTKEKGKGTGLGLSTAFGIVKQSGGNILVYSEPGKGTTFKIYIPGSRTAPELKTERGDEHSRPGVSLQILLVEDEDLLRGLFAAILTNLGHHVAAAAEGGEALLLVKEKGLKPDLVITDVVMPGMSGSALAERLQRCIPSIKMLFMSGYPENNITCREALASRSHIHFIQKPFAIKDLAAKIEQVMCATEKNSS
ncbi:MAG: PAS domain S-box [Nitrospirae bacterium]|nr:MAG: PAS domain S-box [Nitrospirota bacterium]